ncbi:hypothetical protein [Sneathiella aquimaris]|uniref:hypothetical protein n=1 Tax=Sneathiella aquimaris TaxID=2599305 RepID=UPI00146D5237|nr:hypothetical protein [Sneathiella aquimaris]
MDQDAIQSAIRRVFENVGDVAISSHLGVQEFPVYQPGFEPEPTLTEYSVRVIPIKTPVLKSLIATDLIDDEGYQIGLMECEDVVPKSGDQLRIQGTVFSIIQAAPVDLNADLLFEVWYR